MLRRAGAALVTIGLACNALVGLREPIPAPDAPDAADDAPSACVDAGPDAISGVSDFLAALFGAACARMVRCGMIAPSDLADCPRAVEYAQHALQPGNEPIVVRALLRAETNGLLGIDPCGARDCLDALEKGGCDPTSTFATSGRMAPATTDPQTIAFRTMTTFAGPACDHAFVGRSPVGGYCDDPRECVVGSTCLGQPGTCAHVCAPGDECSNAAVGGGCECALGGAGAHCDDWYVTSIYFPACTEFVCAANATCTPVGKATERAPCTYDLMCAPRLYCAAGTCARRLPAGAACASPAACDDGLFCVDGTCRAPTADGGGACSATSTTALGSDGCLAIVEYCDGARCARKPADTLPGPHGCSSIPASFCCTCFDHPCPCERVKGRGEPCTSLDECASFDCANGACN